MPSQISLKYAFILGHAPELSKAEIVSVLGKQDIGFKEIFYNKEIFLLETNQELDVKGLQEKLGGTVKILFITSQVAGSDLEKMIGEIVQTKIKDLGLRIKNQSLVLKHQSLKFQFGFSLYGKGDVKEFKEIGLSIKKKLKESGITCRFVVSKEKSLSSVIVKKERLLEQGMDVVIIEDQGQYYLGQTVAVQDYHNYSVRDYGRPNRDDKSGMLPPKLAKIMINLSGAESNKVILDPFCGSGTILQEALLMGIKNIMGSDISDKAVQDSQNNLNWLRTKYQLDISGVKIFQADARSLSKKLALESVDSIITEPYLGPALSRISNFQFPISNEFSMPKFSNKLEIKNLKLNENCELKIKNLINELSQLYLQSFREFYKVLKMGGRIVIILPIINGQKMEILNNITSIGFKIEPLSNSQRQSIIYGREGTRVEREIFVFRKHE